MKIAQLAPIIETVPPKKYGGTERVVYALTEELVRLGHKVTLFAAGDSITSAKLISVAPKSLREMFSKAGQSRVESKMHEVYGMSYWTILHIGVAYQMQGQFDIIHDHTGQYGILAANNAQTPVVMTLHGAFDEDNKLMYQSLRNPYFVTISDAQAKPAPRLNRLGTVYNGLNMKHYPFSSNTQGYLLFVGRISKEKGVHFAIEVARRVGLPLIIAAKLDLTYDPDVAYFKKYIKPQLSDRIRWVGEVNEEERNELMSKALAFLHPIIWPEPFGLTLIEAMACGCPVIAFDLGSISEVIEDGKSGFVVSSLDQMVEAVKKINKINRQYCREYSLRNFSAQRMAQGYLEYYKKAINLKKPDLIKSLPAKTFVTAYAQDIRRELK